MKIFDVMGKLADAKKFGDAIALSNLSGADLISFALKMGASSGDIDPAQADKLAKAAVSLSMDPQQTLSDFVTSGGLWKMLADKKTDEPRVIRCPHESCGKPIVL